jgi:CelD/BcsL family acetyltransferase involved in cellulose biosynthesis
MIEAPLQTTTVQPAKIALVSDLNILCARKAEWNRLAEQSTTSTIFQTFEWHISWWKTLSDGARPLVLLVERADELVGIAPLMICRRRELGRVRRVIEFIGAGASDYCDFIIDPSQHDVLPLMMRWLAEQGRMWDLLRLTNIPEASPTLSALQAISSHYGCKIDIRALYQAPTRVFGDTAADQQLVRKKSIRSPYNYFRRQGELEFKNCTSVEEIMVYLDRFFQQHTQRWALTDTPGPFLDERQRAFFHELVQALAPTGRLLFSVLLFNQIPIAFHCGFEYGKRIVYYKPSFNVDYFKHSPGLVLLKYLLEYALERGVAEFDFSIGEESYKYRFANRVRKNYMVRVFRHTMSYQFDRFLLDTKSLIKRSPALASLGRRLIRRS